MTTLCKALIACEKAGFSADPHAPNERTDIVASLGRLIPTEDGFRKDEANAWIVQDPNGGYMLVIDGDRRFHARVSNAGDIESVLRWYRPPEDEREYFELDEITLSILHMARAWEFTGGSR